MIFMAWRMLTENRGKFLSMVLALSFAVLLITQQVAIFLGLMIRATGPLQNIAQADLWITDPNVRFINRIRPLNQRDLDRVRSTPGVAWAQPFFKSFARIDLPNGSFQYADLLGIDRATLIGQPPILLQGKMEDLRAPDAVMVEQAGRRKLPGVELGSRMQMGDQRAVVVGFCRARPSLESDVLVYTTYENALRYSPAFDRRTINVILVKVREGEDPNQVARHINQHTDLYARTPMQMQWSTYDFVLRETGIGINFGITVTLGFLVGLVLVGTTFYQFTLENLRNFAVLKAMGTQTRTLVRMVLFQAIVAGLIGYGIGVGLAGLFSLPGRRPGAELSTHFPWQLMLGSFVTVMVCVGLASLLSLRRVIQVEPASVFK